jgi:hypothetical protein
MPFLLALLRSIGRRLKPSDVRALKLAFDWSRALVILMVALLGVALALETVADVVALIRSAHDQNSLPLSMAEESADL